MGRPVAAPAGGASDDLLLAMVVEVFKGVAAEEVAEDAAVAVLRVFVLLAVAGVGLSSVGVVVMRLRTVLI